MALLLLLPAMPPCEAATSVQVPTLAWVKRAGGPTEDYGWAVAIDTAQNVAVAGHVTATAEFDGSNPSAFGGLDIILAKYSSYGQLLWVIGAGGPGDDEARGVTADASGNFYLTGSFTSPGSFGSVTVQNSAPNTFFLAKYDPKGNLIWIRQSTGSGASEGHAVALDPLGNIVVAGFFNEVASFEGATVASHGAADAFLAKYDAAGHLLWVRSGGGAKDDDAAAVATDRSGAVIVAGQFKDAAIFDSTTRSNFSGGNFFIAKYDPDGQLLWVRNSGGGDKFSVNEAGGVAVDFQGSIYVTGVFGGTPRFGDVVLPNTGESDIFVAKYSSEGQVLWVRGFGDTGPDQGRAATLDANGYLYVAGFFYDSAVFDSYHLRGTNHAEAFVVKFAPNGQVEWAWQPGGSAYKSANGLGVTSDGTCYLTGFFRGTTDFGNVTLTNNFVSNRDIFIARVDGPASRPRLTITPEPGNLVLSWPGNAATFALESVTSLGALASWLPVTNPAVKIGNWNVLTNRVATNRFYRLRSP